MNKEYISYAIIGIVAGIVLGFLVANWTGAGVGAVQQAAEGGPPASASVNSSSSNEDLPPGHPPIEGAEPTPAPPLPAGGQPAGSTPSASASAPAEGSLELPSLEPLPASSKEERAEQKYKNIQLFRGLPADRIESIMFSFKAALGVECTHCHVKDHFEKDDKAAKQIARKMIKRTRAINSDGASGGRVTCFTCHRGQLRPPS